MNLSLISQCLRIYWPVIYMINKKSETKKKKNKSETVETRTQHFSLSCRVIYIKTVNESVYIVFTCGTAVYI